MSSKQFFIKRITALFKVDKDDKLALILCTGLKVASNNGSISRSFVRHVDNINWEAKFKISGVHSLKIAEENKKVEQKIKAIFRPVSRQNTDRTYFTAISKKEDKCIFCLKPIFERRANITYKQIVDMHTCLESENEGSDWHIPLPFKRLYPFMSKGEYVTKLGTEEWMKNRTPCCEECWITIYNFNIDKFKRNPEKWREKLLNTVGLQVKQKSYATSPRHEEYGNLMNELGIEAKPLKTVKLPIRAISKTAFKSNRPITAYEPREIKKTKIEKCIFCKRKYEKIQEIQMF